MLDVTKQGRHVATLYPSEGFYASEEASQGTVGSLIGGQPVSHVALDAGSRATSGRRSSRTSKRPRCSGS